MKALLLTTLIVGLVLLTRKLPTWLSRRSRKALGEAPVAPDTNNDKDKNETKSWWEQRKDDLKGERGAQAAAFLLTWIAIHILIWQTMPEGWTWYFEERESLFWALQFTALASGAIVWALGGKRWKIPVGILATVVLVGIFWPLINPPEPTGLVVARYNEWSEPIKPPPGRYLVETIENVGADNVSIRLNGNDRLLVKKGEPFRVGKGDFFQVKGKVPVKTVARYRLAPEQVTRARVAKAAAPRKVAKTSLSFGLYSIELEPGQTTPRLCTPGRSVTTLTRADKSVRLTYWVTPPGSASEVRVLQPSGPAVPLPPNQCIRVEAGSRTVELTAEVKPLNRT